MATSCGKRPSCPWINSVRPWRWACTHTHTHTRTHTHTPHHAAQQFSCEVQVGPYSCCLLLIRTTTRSTRSPRRLRSTRRWPTLCAALQSSLECLTPLSPSLFTSGAGGKLLVRQTFVKRWRIYSRYYGGVIGGPAPTLALAMKRLRRQLLRDREKHTATVRNCPASRVSVRCLEVHVSTLQ